jgi:hypothetical protein
MGLWGRGWGWGVEADAGQVDAVVGKRCGVCMCLHQRLTVVVAGAGHAFVSVGPGATFAAKHCPFCRVLPSAG